MISELNTPPACAPVNASPASLRLPAHDWGSGRFATPFLCGSFIRDSKPVYPGAFPESCLFKLPASFSSSGHKFERLAVRPGPVARGEPNAVLERRVGVQPEAHEGIGIRIFQVFFTRYLKGLNICGVGVSYNPISYFQAELVGLVLVMM